MNNSEMTQKQALQELLKRIKKYWPMLVSSLVLALVYVVLSLYVPKLIGEGTDLIVSKGNVDFKGLARVGTSIAICAAVAGLSQWLMGLINNRISYSVIQDIRQEGFEKIQKLPLSYIDAKSTGSIVSNIIADVDQVAEGLLMGFSNLFTGVVTIVLTLVFMLQINWKIALVVICITPVSFVVAGTIAKRTYSMFRKQSESRAKQTSFIDEIISGQKVVKAFGQEENMISEFDDINEELTNYYLKGTFYSSLTNPSTRFVNNIVYAGVAISGGLIAVITGGISVGGLATILSYANQYTKPFNEISGVITELQNAIACGAKVFTFINQDDEPDVECVQTIMTNENRDKSADVIEPTDGNNVEEKVTDGGAISNLIAKNVIGNVDIEDVYFSYEEGQKLIEDFNLNVKAGQRIAIVGPTGCGKTTVINLLMRFYDVNSGTIKVDERDIQDISRKELRNNYGMVLQETWLRNGTIKDNIAFGKPDASDEEIIEAAKASYAHNFIKRLPDGYDTIIGESGGNLSQGQKQLLCIARVMLCLPPMLILDEATSSIDTRTEMKIQNAFSRMMEGRTTFIVAHRLSTIKEADLILVMKDGKIIEQGNHDELMRTHGFYYELNKSM